MDSLKRRFKGLFTKKKGKQEQKRSSSAQPTAQKTATPQIAHTQKAEQSTNPKPELDTRATPSQSQATAGQQQQQQQQPHNAIRQGHDGQADPAPQPTVAGGPEGSDAATQLGREADKAFGSFGSGPTMGEDVLRSEPVNAQAKPVEAAGTPKKDGAAEAVQAAPSEAAIAAPAGKHRSNRNNVRAC